MLNMVILYVILRNNDFICRNMSLKIVVVNKKKKMRKKKKRKRKNRANKQKTMMTMMTKTTMMMKHQTQAQSVTTVNQMTCQSQDLC